MTSNGNEGKARVANLSGMSRAAFAWVSGASWLGTCIILQHQNTLVPSDDTKGSSPMILSALALLALPPRAAPPSTPLPVHLAFVAELWHSLFELLLQAGEEQLHDVTLLCSIGIIESR